MRYIITSVLLFLSAYCFSQTAIEKGLSVINKSEAVTYIGILASDSLQGRGAGKTGGIMAAEYIKSVFENLGIKPWRGKYFQPFTRHIGNNPNYEMRNVLGYIEGKNTWEIVMIGAHYDHLGIKANNTNDSIYNGADDNATGVSAVLQIAKAFAASEQKPERTIIFALWDGEEMGLLGSSHFVEDHSSYIPIPLVASVPVKGYINCDMIGRDKDGDGSHVDISFTDSKPVFAEWIKSDIEKYKLALAPQFPSLESTPGGSDHVPFMRKGTPVIFYNTGLHPDYHKPSDEATYINYDKVVDITKLAYLNLWNMANLISF
ncbi:M20/M25/M40 family metallo-hydrolase [Dysgonomonas sp. Marseille-P4677]|uniref:M20/M25/M40 family metallo-hydrolase n=1 Tax=Dysgonomonas sp. Marseille-P4677 TaxID=2364790 RepID=UPI00191304D8|nr:M20/M25/M40 family metallo-hydrolase [Dysgonomonas sp. Marseille-P4677]MBK5720028.1 M20/M25/M40 family metallo-hydrolase [Dysgonomonas sp. Marseille-P4677]